MSIEMTSKEQNQSEFEQSKQLTPHRWAEVIKAWADGHAIQSRILSPKADNTDWKDYRFERNVKECQPRFGNEELEWRIKPEQKTGWINIYDHVHPEGGCVFESVEKAKEGRDRSRLCIACIQITYTEGEGL